MPIPHLIHLGLRAPQVSPPFSTPLETFPQDEIVGSVDTGTSMWNGVAQIFALPIPQNFSFLEKCYLAFRIVSPTVAGLTYRAALYREISQGRAVCLAKSRKITTDGTMYGDCWIRLDGSADIHVNDKCYIAFTISMYNSGSMNMACRPTDYAYQAQHITSPNAFNADSQDSDWNEIGYGGWSSDKNIWFALTNQEVGERLP